MARQSPAAAGRVVGGTGPLTRRVPELPVRAFGPWGIKGLLCIPIAKASRGGLTIRSSDRFQPMLRSTSSDIPSWWRSICRIRGTIASGERLLVSATSFSANPPRRRAPEGHPPRSIQARRRRPRSNRAGHKSRASGGSRRLRACMTVPQETASRRAEFRRPCRRWLVAEGVAPRDVSPFCPDSAFAASCLRVGQSRQSAS